MVNWCCSRCGAPIEKLPYCVHSPSLLTRMSRGEGERVRARYALGKLHNPDHDTTSYRDDAYTNS